MFEGAKFGTAERIMRYVQIDTQSDPLSSAHPTTEKQKMLSKLLAEELQDTGIENASMDEWGYVYATIVSNSDKEIPAIAFCAHVDTAPDCSGTGVKPIIHKNYDGSDIVLPDDASVVLSRKDFPYLEKHIGADIITASGTTLLGGDDKAGVAIIMSLAKYLSDHPEIKHGTVKILFTPDEEVGKGTAKVDLEKLGAKFGYTLDGGEAGDLEDETFSADAVKIIVHGVSAHPGYAKGKLVNALKIAGEILASLPKLEWSPETTEKRLGFVHPVRIEGIAERATIEFIIRDFETGQLETYEDRLRKIAENIVNQYAGAKMEFVVEEQYRNMKEVLVKFPEVTDNAAEAYRRAGLTVTKRPIRGGTDGSKLSFMGLPCPNIFTGMQGIHSKKEWIGIKDMEKAVETLLHLLMIWEEKAG